MSVELGLRIISVAKSLEAFQSGDAKISQYFGATRLAGRGGLLASALRKQTRISYDKLKIHAAEAKIDGPTLTKFVLPWLQKSGFAEVDEQKTIVVCNVVDYDAILKETYKHFASLDPTAEERAVLVILEMASEMPTTRSAAFTKLAGYGGQVSEVALELATGYHVLRVADGEGLAEPVLYSPIIWGDNIGKASRALSHMDATERAVLLELISRVSKYQGMPEVAAKIWLKGQNLEKLCDFAVQLGLLDRTEILTKEGIAQNFLTTPHLYGEIAAKHGRDVCDRVRLFLDSIRHGQHYGNWMTGKINDPAVLLNALLRTGEIGPCTAIGTDYILVERAGIVTVSESWRKGRYVMKLVQDDTVQVITEMLSQPHGLGALGAFSSVGPSGQHQFVSSEQARPRLGQLSPPLKQAERQMLRSLREMG